MSSLIDQLPIIYCDGACSGNPGPGGWAFILSLPMGQVIEGAGSEAQTTNNRMELLAVQRSLETLRVNDLAASKVVVYSDSVYVIRGATQWIFGWMRNGWKTSQGEEVSNKEIWQSLFQLVHKSGLKVEFKHVRGHAGIAGNERCDELAGAASKGLSFELFDGSREFYHFDLRILPPDLPLPEMKSGVRSSDSGGESAFYLSLVNGVLMKHKTWGECEAQVKGRPGVKFKKVKSEQEQKQVLEAWGVAGKAFTTK